MEQSASVEILRYEIAYWNAELALAISYHQHGFVNDQYLENRIRAVDNINQKKPPLAHKFTGKKRYSRV